MKKFVKSMVILAVVVVAFGSAGAVFAQTSTDVAPLENARGGRGGFGRGCGLMGQESGINLDGVLHEALVAAFADALGLPADEIETRLADGETMAEIALSTGMSLEDFRILMDEVRQEVVEKALADGILTEEQAAWFAARSARRFGSARMSGTGQGRGNRGVGRGQFGSGTCMEE